MKKITVIVPCYHSAKYLPTLWKSLKEQTIGLENLRCVFVDDASQDNGETVDYLRELQAEAPNSVMVIFSDENRMQGGARNIGMRAIDSEWVQFVDADDCLSVDALEKLYNVATRYDVDLIQYRARDVKASANEDNRKRTDRLFDLAMVRDRKDMLSSGLVNTSHNAKLYRRSIIKHSGVKFAEHLLYEEPLFVYPQYFYVRRVAILDEALYLRSYHGDNATFTMNQRLQLDHPKVQKQLLEFLRERSKVTSPFEEEMEEYFLWTYFVETVINAGRTMKTALPLDFFAGMQQVCSKEFPRFAKNPYIRQWEQPFREILAAISQEFTTQEAVDDFVHRAARDVTDYVVLPEEH